MTGRVARLLATAGLLAALPVVGGCEGDGPGWPYWRMEAARLEAAAERWREREPRRYAFEYRRGCFCDPGTTARVRLTVEDGELVEAIYLEEVRRGPDETIPAGDPVPDELLHAFGPVDAILERIGRAIGRRPVEFDVEYSAEHGYPVEARIVDCLCPDAGSVETVTAFEPLAS